jgi:hypothetical protein
VGVLEKGMKEVALAKIARILKSDRSRFVPFKEWEHICREILDFYDVYQYNQEYFEEPGYYHSDNEFNPQRGIFNILKAAYERGPKTFRMLFEVIVDEQLFDLNVLLYDNKEYEYIFGVEREEMFQARGNDVTHIKNENFHRLIKYLNIFDLNIRLKKGKFKLEDYSDQIVFDLFETVNEIDAYIAKHTNRKIQTAYNEIATSYAEQNYGQCIESCRVVIDGFFFGIANGTDKAYEGALEPSEQVESWFKGISKIAGDPRPVINIKKDLLNDHLNLYHPRFRMIYNFYRMLCTLGSHRANETADIYDENDEKSTQEDALMCLQITRSIIYAFLKKRDNQIFELLF